MIVGRAQGPYFTPEEYLEFERLSPIKHEYRRGLVTAMAGVSTAHILITRNLSIILFNHLRGDQCTSYGSDAKVQIPGRKGYYYPDQLVPCDAVDLSSNDGCVRHPMLIFEGLSDSTEAFDRKGKFDDYKTIPELEEYVLVDQHRMLVECFRRKGDFWVSETYETGESVTFVSIRCTCEIELVYEGAERFLMIES